MYNKEKMKLYQQTPAFRVSGRKYRHSPKGRATRWAYRHRPEVVKMISIYNRNYREKVKEANSAKIS